MVVECVSAVKTVWGRASSVKSTQSDANCKETCVHCARKRH